MKITISKERLEELERFEQIENKLYGFQIKKIDNVNIYYTYLGDDHHFAIENECIAFSGKGDLYKIIPMTTYEITIVALPLLWNSINITEDINLDIETIGNRVKEKIWEKAKQICNNYENKKVTILFSPDVMIKENDDNNEEKYLYFKFGGIVE